VILYSCEPCGFRIAGSHPETAEDEYELRQDIDAHEESHRREFKPAVTANVDEETLRSLAKKGAVILPAVQLQVEADDVEQAPVVGLSIRFDEAVPEFREKYEGTHMTVEVMVPIGWAPVLTLSSSLEIVTPDGVQPEIGDAS
jgi:hypothetical protein